MLAKVHVMPCCVHSWWIDTMVTRRDDEHRTSVRKSRCTSSAVLRASKGRSPMQSHVMDLPSRPTILSEQGRTLMSCSRRLCRLHLGALSMMKECMPSPR